MVRHGTFGCVRSSCPDRVPTRVEPSIVSPRYQCLPPFSVLLLPSSRNITRTRIGFTPRVVGSSGLTNTRVVWISVRHVVPGAKLIMGHSVFTAELSVGD